MGAIPRKTITCNLMCCWVGFLHNSGAEDDTLWNRQFLRWGHEYLMDLIQYEA